MNDRLRDSLCEILATHGRAIASNPARCAELLWQVSADRPGVEALLKAVEAHIPARLGLLTDSPVSEPSTSALVRQLMEEQRLSEAAARWAVDTWSLALRQTPAAREDTPSPSHLTVNADHLFTTPARRFRIGRWLLAALLILAPLGAWWWHAQRAEIARLTARTNGITALALSHDGRHLLAGCGDQTLRLWDLSTLQEIERLEGHEGSPTGVVLAANGTMALSSGGIYQTKDRRIGPVDCVLRQWSIPGSGPGRKLVESPVPLYGVLLMPGGQQIVTFGGGHELKEGDFLRKDNKTVSRECHLWLHEIENGREVRRFVGHKEPVRSAAVTPNGQMLISAGAEGTLKFWDVATGKERRTLEPDGKQPILTMAVSNDGRRLLMSDGTGRLRILNLDSEKEEFDARVAHTGPIRAVAFSPDGRWALSGGEDYTVRIWDLETGTERRHFTGHSGAVTSLLCLPDGQRAISGSVDGTIRIWRLPR